MTFRPSGYIGWCSTGATNVTEPLDSKKAVGWAVNEAPLSSYENWLQQKTDAWLKYFDWMTSLEPVVVDDFVYATGHSATGFLPQWFKTSGGYQIQEDNSALGVAFCFNANSTGIFDLSAPVGGGPAGRDFRMEFINKYSDRGNSGAFMEMGILSYLSFMITGPSGNYGLHFRPTGGAATSVDLGVDPITTVYKKLVIERHGATMIVQIDDVTKATLPGAWPGVTGASAMQFGMRSVNNDVNQFPTQLVDKAGFWVRRNPV